ncbi:hypothetical protein FF098_011640 [Parvularcula flava]|nr:hypothetical protein [Aquisalinus luteolus]NHK28560.1 hypothetical protein [Aquisalinus luteolus]
MILLLMYFAWMGLMAVGYSGTAAEDVDGAEALVTANEDGYGTIATLR